MLSTIIINYWGARLLDTYRSKAKLILSATILLNLSFLFYFKYFDFVIANINHITSANIPLHKIIMPIGISFYTFQAISYLVDVYRKETAVQKDIYKLALYITLFPQLVAGPIVKYHDIDKQIEKRSVTLKKVSLGVKRFIIGLAKKFSALQLTFGLGFYSCYRPLQLRLRLTIHLYILGFKHSAGLIIPYRRFNAHD